MIEQEQLPKIRKKPGRKPRVRLTDATSTMEREPVREPIRDNPREEVGERLTRKRKGHIDQYAIDKRVIPAGMSYEWKRHTVYNERDPSYEIALQENGWRPVPASRHPQYMPSDWKGGTIDRGGLRLYERPMELTLEARMEDDEAAIEAVNAKRRAMGETPQGTFTRDHPSARVATKLNKSYEPLPPGAIPNDE